MDEPRRVRLSDTWHPRELPVLVAIAEAKEAGDYGIRARHLASSMGMDFDQVILAVEALTPTYVSAKPLDAWGGRMDWGIQGLTEAGRRAVGLWPDDRPVLDFIDALNRAAEATSDPEEKTLLRRAAGQLGMVSRDILIDITAAVMAKHAGV